YRGEPAFDVLRANAQLVRETVIADKVGLAVDEALCAASAAVLVILRSRKLYPAFLSVLDDGFCQRMRRVDIYSRRDPQDFLLRTPADSFNSQHSRSSFGNRSGLVERERLKLRDRFQMRATLHEHAATGHRREAGDDA